MAENKDKLANTNPDDVSADTQKEKDSQAPDKTADEELKKKVEALERQNGELQQKVTELATTKATLEQRYEELKPPTAKSPEGEMDLSDVLAEDEYGNKVVDPSKLGKKLSQMQNTMYQQIAQNVSKGVDEVVSVRLAAEKIKQEKPHLAKLAPHIETRVYQLLNQGKDAMTALDEAVKEFEAAFKTYDEVKKGQEQPVETPRGAQGKTGEEGEKPSSPPEEIPTDADWVKKRQEAMAKRFML